MGLLPDLIHIALASEWEQARTAGRYERSTRGRALSEVGYIHMSFAWQVERVASFVYDGETDPLVLLRVDPERLSDPVRIENLEGGSECFPHLYGPLPVSAVIDVLPFVRRDGQLRLPEQWVVGQG